MPSPFARNISALRESLGMTQEQLADALGVTRATVFNWEHGKSARPKQPEIIELIKDKFSVSDADLFGFSEGFYSKLYQLSNVKAAVASDTYAPVVGNVAAGDPREAFEYETERIWVPPELLERDRDVFFLRVSGDSMDRTEYQDGTYAAISPHTEVHNGDIAAVKVNGDDATLKVYKEYDGVIHLEPRSHNADYRRIVIDSTDPDAVYFRILGKAIWPYYPIRF